MMNSTSEIRVKQMIELPQNEGAVQVDGIFLNYGHNREKDIFNCIKALYVKRKHNENELESLIPHAQDNKVRNRINSYNNFANEFNEMARETGLSINYEKWECYIENGKGATFIKRMKKNEVLFNDFKDTSPDLWKEHIFLHLK